MICIRCNSMVDYETEDFICYDCDEDLPIRPEVSD